MNDAFKRILALARRTGDRMIVTDPEGQEAFVLLNLDQYEALLGGVKDEPGLPTPPVPVVELPKVVEEEQKQKPSAESPVKETPTPISTKKEEPEEFGEEQFYLEPIE